MKATRTIFAFALSTLSFCGSARAAQYDFDFWAIHIFNTRSRGTDTDYAFFSIKVGTKQYDTVAKRLGNLNNGDTNIHIGFSNIDIPDPGIAVKLTWSVVNSGHGSDAQYKNAFDTTAGPFNALN
jgi:hypothetical protein